MNHKLKKSASGIILRMTCFVILLFAALFVLLPFSAHSAGLHEDTGVNDKMSNRELINLADSLIRKDTLTDRTMGALTIVLNRYYEAMDYTAARHDAVIAARKLGNIYMTRDIDYRKAYRNLSLARSIAEEDGLYFDLAHIYSSLANIYLWGARNNAAMHKYGEKAMLDATEAAYKSHNEIILYAITFNMMIMSVADTITTFDNTLHEIRKYKFDDSSIGQSVALLVDGYDDFRNGDYMRAAEKVEQTRLFNDNETLPERTEFSTGIILYYILDKAGEYDRLVGMLRKDLDKAESGGYKDYELSILGKLANYYNDKGNGDSTDYYYNRYLRLKEEFESERGYGNVADLEFLSEIEKVNAELEQLSIKHQEEKRRRVVAFAILAVALVLFLSLLWHYINLRRNQRLLYQRNEEMMRREEQHKMLRRQWEEERAQLMESKEEGLSQPPTEVGDVNTPAESAESIAELQELYSRVLEKMETSSAVLSGTYSIGDLARSLGVSARLVSRAINVCHNSNFHQLLNECRIREAVRLMHDRSNDNLTIEGIAEMAGFKNRTHFATTFKKHTGLTPSEYVRMARK